MRRPDPAVEAMVEALGLPQPERSQILEEIAADVAALRAELVARGMEPVAARTEALRLLAPSGAAVAALASVHEPLYRSLARRFSSRMRLAEWIGLVGVTVAALTMALMGLAGSDMFGRPSPFLVAVFGVAALVVTMAGRKAIQLFLARDHHAARLRSGMGALLIASGGGVLVAVAGAVVGLWRLAARVEANPGMVGELVLPWLLDTALLVASGLVTALVGGLAWFLLLQKIAAVEGAELRATRVLGRAVGSRAGVTPTRLSASLHSTGAET